MSTASHAVDPMTTQRLRSRRLVIVDVDPERAHAFAQALRESGATVVSVTPTDTSHAAVHALDADVMLVNEDQPEPCRPLVIALRSHPRTRWTTVLPISFAAFRPREGHAPDTGAIAGEVNRLATTVIELTVRAKGKLPYGTALEPLGPSRILRALGNTQRSLRVTFSNDRIRAAIELDEGRVRGVCAWIGAADPPLANAEALFSILAMSSGELLIEERGEPMLSSWNAALPAALEAAAAIASVPNEAVDAPLVDGSVPARDELVLDPGFAPLSPHLQPTVPQISLANVMAEATAMGLVMNAEESAAQPAAGGNAPRHGEPAPEVVFEPAPEPSADGVATAHAAQSSSAPPRPRGRARILSLGFMLIATIALWTEPYLRSARSWPVWPRVENVLARSHGLAAAKPARGATRLLTGSLAAATEPAAQPTAVPGAVQAESSPAAGQRAAVTVAEIPSAEAPVAPREPSRAQLEQAQRATKRGHRYMRSKRYDPAASAYEKALELVPNHIPAMPGLIRIRLHDGNAAAARRWAERLATLLPDDKVTQLLLGDAYALSGDAALAAEAWRRSRALGSEVARKRLRRR